MAQTPKKQKKCARCGTPAEITFTHVEGGKSTGEKTLCKKCAMKEGIPILGRLKTPLSRLDLLVKVLEHAIWWRDNVSTIVAHLKELTGKDLPADPAVWRRWIKEHPEETKVDEEKFGEVLAELGFKVGSPGWMSPPEGRTFLRSIPEDKLGFLVDVLEDALERGQQVSTVHACIGEAAGKDLPADPAAWREWMTAHPTEVRIDKEKFLNAVTELKLKLFYDSPKGPKKLDLEEL